MNAPDICLARRPQAFAAPRAERHDACRGRPRPGREDMIAQLGIHPGAHVVELGCGTGSCLDLLGARVGQVARLDLVDLSPALLAVARQRAAGCANVRVHEADAACWRPARPVDRVIVSHALTTMPGWQQVIANAFEMLVPGGRIGVADFHLPAHGLSLGKRFWRHWFAHAGLRLSASHLAALQRRFPEYVCAERHAPVPYLPGLRAPYYWFVGRRPDWHAGHGQ